VQSSPSRPTTRATFRRGATSELTARKEVSAAFNRSFPKILLLRPLPTRFPPTKQVKEMKAHAQWVGRKISKVAVQVAPRTFVTNENVQPLKAYRDGKVVQRFVDTRSGWLLCRVAIAPGGIRCSAAALGGCLIRCQGTDPLLLMQVKTARSRLLEAIARLPVGAGGGGANRTNEAVHSRTEAVARPSDLELA